MDADPHLLLAVAEGLGPACCSTLLAPDLDPERALAQPPPDLPPAVQRRLADRDRLVRTAAAWVAAAANEGLTLLTPSCADYPERLREMPLRPLVLFARGPCELLRGPRHAVAVVGSRTPTPYGQEATAHFGSELARAGVLIWSGLAYGIDALAHQAALRAGTPTVAVLAGGLDRIYPSTHATLAAAILAAGGLLLTELPPGMPATRGHFPRRNRILAGAVAATLVVEAGLASGSLLTARFAAEVGSQVFAVPGPYASPRSRGCHDLIADGAQIACDPEDVLRRLGLSAAVARGESEGLELPADASAILRVLAAGARPKDLVQRETRLERGAFLRALLHLTGSGCVDCLPGDLLAVRRGLPG